jgi:hypothetical protein
MQFLTDLTTCNNWPDIIELKFVHVEMVVKSSSVVCMHLITFLCISYCHYKFLSF